MSDSFNITARSREEHLVDALHRLDEFLAARSFSSQQCYALRLAFEELASNVIRHQSEECTFSATIDVSPLTMVFTDDGSEFNPLQGMSVPDIRLPLEQRTAGKLGIHLVRNLVPGMTYERQNGRNVIRMQFEGGE